MYKKTVLKIVQDALEVMGSHQVDSLTASDTPQEALDVANIAKQTYEFMVSRYDWEFQKELNVLEGLADNDYPTYLKIPDAVSEVEWFRYDTEELKWMDKEAFLDMLNERKASFDAGTSGYISKTSLNGITLYLRDDKAPEYYTSFDNEYIITDSYDSSVDSVLQASKTAASVVKLPVFTIDDAFTPDIPDGLVATFQAEVNRACFVYIKQQDSLIDTKRALEGKARLRTKESKLNKRKRFGFGRK